VRSRSVAWIKEDPFGVEFAEVNFSPRSLTAAGVAIGTEPFVYRLDYSLETGEDFVTSHLSVTVTGERLQRALDLQRSSAGAWSAGNVDLPGLDGALDCDLGLCPLTNTMPVLRHELLDGSGTAHFVMAWVSVPDLAVHAAPQRYTALRDRVVRFESLDSAFTADLTFDADGLVVDYPQLARRLSSPSGR
jgi:uncharacterized protein